MSRLVALGITILALIGNWGSSSAQRMTSDPGSLLGAVPAARAVAASTQSLAGRVDPATYVVGPGDQFELNLSGAVTRVTTLVVSPEGTLFVPSLGTVDVDGRTLDAVRREVLKRVSAQYRGVATDLRLAKVRRLLVHVTGEVRNSGTIEILASSRLSDVLPDTALAAHASRRNVLVRRARGGEVIGDLDRYRRTGALADDPYLWDGDVIVVPAATLFVRIEGGIAHPGQFELGPHDSLSTLFALGGGPTPDAEAVGSLVRFTDASHTEAHAFDLPAVVAGRYDEALRDGDRVLVVRIPRFHDSERAYVDGEVARPGPYEIQPGRTHLSELLTHAGGTLDRADLSSVRIYRASSGAQASDPELDRLLRLSRAEMTSSEYEIFRARLTARRLEFRVDATRFGARPESDPVLLDDDVVRVEPALASVRVEGQVRRPGLITFQAGRSPEAYVQLAGGFAERANSGQLRVTRAGTGQTIFAHDVSSIDAGDLIWVPERGDSTLWHDLQQFVLVAAQVATVILAVKR